jgi:23S rRNA pseudouridine1911/1915/1917 synthase
MAADKALEQAKQPPNRLTYTGQVPVRLDAFVAGALAHLSRMRAQAFIAEGRVLVNGRVARASTRLASGDVVEVDEQTSQPASRPVGALAGEEQSPSQSLAVVFEDEQMLVVNKPTGLVVHPAPGQHGPTLVELLLARAPALAELPGPATGRWPGLVHRLDKETSGLLLVAKTPQALLRLSEQFQARTVVKRYLALLHGQLPLKEGAIEAPIGRDPRQRQRMAVVARGGRAAETLFWVEREFARFTLAKVQILTGRTHQIRVHFAAIGHPVAGDTRYGPTQGHASAPNHATLHGPQPPRLFLHAQEVQVRHPTTGELLAFTALLPADLQGFLETLLPEASSEGLSSSVSDDQAQDVV